MDFENIPISGLAGVLAGLSDEELIGVIKRNPAMVRKALDASRKGGVIEKQNSRTELAARMSSLDKNLQQGLLQKSNQLVDTYLSVVKSVSGASSVKMLKSADTDTVGVCMINGAKLEKDQPFMMTAIRLLYGVGGGTTENASTISAVNFGIISSVIAGGYFEFKAGSRTLIPAMSCEVFKTAFEKNVVEDTSPDYAYGYAISNGAQFGMYKLENPKLIESQIPLEFNIDWGTAAASNAFLKVILIGSRVYKH